MRNRRERSEDKTARLAAAATALWLVLGSLVFAPAAGALEIYRNGVRYDIDATLPDGADFEVDGVDRKFSIGPVEGNLRLIQDTGYDDCARLVDERVANWRKYGFTLSDQRFTSDSECSVTIGTPASDAFASSYYIRIDDCDCFSALHFRYSRDDRDAYEAAFPEIVASIRANNAALPPSSGAGRPGDAGSGHAASALSGLSCISEDLFARMDLGTRNEFMVTAFSAWSAMKVDDIARGAGIWENEGYSLDLADGRLERVAGFLPEALGAMAEDVERYGDRLCPLVVSMTTQDLNYGYVGLSDLRFTQRDFNSLFHDYLRLAQSLMMRHGCYAGALDGAFGPASRAAWNRMRQGLGLQPRDGEFTPTVSDLAAIADIPVTGRACEDGGGVVAENGEGIRLLDFLYPAHQLPPLDRPWVRETLGPAFDQMTARGRFSGLEREAVVSLLPEGAATASTGAESHVSAVAELFGYDGPAWGEADYFAAMESERAAIPFTVEAAARQSQWREVQTYDVPIGMFTTSDFGLVLSISDRDETSRVANVVLAHPGAFEALKATSGPAYEYVLAERMLQGATTFGKSAAGARGLLEDAADKGAPYAMAHLALMLEYGQGGAKDPERALRLYEEAAAAGEGFAMAQLAVRTDKNTSEAIAKALFWYEALIGVAEERIADRGPDADWASVYSWIADFLANRMMDGSPALLSPAGDALITTAAEQSAAFAARLAETNLCAECGAVLDEAEGAKWLAIAADNGDTDALFKLVRLIEAFPQLSDYAAENSLKFFKQRYEQAPDDFDGAQARRESAVGAVAYDVRLARASLAGPEVVKAAEAALERVCDDDWESCENVAKQLSAGRYGADLVSVGFDRLKALDSLELVDVLAAYGDFRGAAERAQRAEGYELSGLADPRFDEQATNLRDATIRRLVENRAPGDLQSLPEGLVGFLGLMAANGDKAAADFLRLIRAADPEVEPPLPDLQSAAETFAEVRARGGTSLGLVNSARRYGDALQASGDNREALAMELTALSAELRLDRLRELSDGPLSAELTRVCHLSNASERAFALGSDSLAVLLAKQAINRLQVVRADLATLPEDLRGCFRDLIADNYRWLADLFIQQDRLSDAEFVLGLLKDFEAFQFTDRDLDFVGDAFATLPLTEEEAVLQAAINALQPPSISDVRERDALISRQEAGTLTDAEEERLNALNADLAAANAAYEAGLQTIFAALSDLEESAPASETPLAEQSVQATILSGLETNAVALHYLVMPDRLNILLTSRDEQLSYTIDSWNGEPFSEATLNGALADLHLAFNDFYSDPRAESELLYDLLIDPVADDLARIDPDLLLVSQDRRLRYLPYQALYDGERYLVERYDVASLTSSESEITGVAVAETPFAGLGLTRAVGDFSELPGVALEFGGLLSGEERYGFMEGELALDEAFDRAALSEALTIGGSSPVGAGTVHVASHFVLGNTEDDSYLLLGTGEHLPISEIKGGAGDFDFSNVDLLTWSACETGRANPGSDGREIESLAKITGERGAKATLATLWPVLDISTPLIMQRFYELREFGGLSKAEALATAQREFIQRRIGDRDVLDRESVVFQTAGRLGLPADPGSPITFDFDHPIFWAPFMLMGNWR
ncbi:CHAT domain-containing protein [Martelella radicis]|uniref:CHAT domain-containing protein/TPR repeat protein n=1 Tax=Martelella radicis TaxID=1397476 RepID=A0A7W6P987_9HYPH|nr:CHAT domain-containing protein [Martelella radicis]MBB4120279.1 CHAT domain-containing protein/TPR repeat protein [Martelella radicis]